MYVLTIIDPNGDWQEIAFSTEAVAAFLEKVDWASTLRVIVTWREK